MINYYAEMRQRANLRRYRDETALIPECGDSDMLPESLAESTYDNLLIRSESFTLLVHIPYCDLFVRCHSRPKLKNLISRISKFPGNPRITKFLETHLNLA